MVNLLVGSKNIDETNIFCNSLANDKEYKIKTANTAISTISTYLNIKPDILILDNSLTDLSIENIINKLSYSPIEEENCNIILTVPKNYNLQLNNIAKINKIVYKPIINNELIIALKNMSDRHNTPDLKVNEVDSLLQRLNINYLSAGFIYLREAIIHCYYNPQQLASLTKIQKFLSEIYSVPESRVRDSMNSCIRPFNSTNCELNSSSYLYKILYNNGYKLSLKDFLERIVLFFIKEKGRLI